MIGRERILKVAEDLFIEKGFSETSMQDVAERAGVSKSLIYQNYDSKQSLWQAAIENCNSMSEPLEYLCEALSVSDPETMLSLLTRSGGFCDFFGKNPRMIRLFTWLDLERDFEPGLTEECIRQKILERIREMQRIGMVRPDVEPALIPVMLLSMMMHWFSARRSLVRWMDGGIPDEDLDDAFIGGMMNILMKGILSDAKD